MKKFLRYLVILVIVMIFGGTIYLLYSKSKPKKLEYEEKSPIITDIVKNTIATGSVVPRKEIEIKPQSVSGIVEEIYVKAGQMIRKNDLIAKVKIIPEMINLNNAESRVKRAKISLEDVKIDYERSKKLYNKKVIPFSDHQKVELRFKNAKEELNTAEDNLQLIKEGVTKKSINATNTLIKSTINGMVLNVPIKEGNSVIQSNTFNAGTTIAVVADMQEMIFKGKVDETEVGKLSNDMKFQIIIGAIQNVKFDAILEYISPKGVIENGATQFEIEAEVKLKDDFFIRAGYSANAEIPIEKKEQVLAIDESLIKYENDSTYVFVKSDPNMYEKVAIKTGISDGINIEVISGIDKSDVLRGKLKKYKYTPKNKSKKGDKKEKDSSKKDSGKKESKEEKSKSKEKKSDKKKESKKDKKQDK